MRQGIEEMLQFEKRTEEKKTRVYTYENAVERCYICIFTVFLLVNVCRIAALLVQLCLFMCFRLLAANKTLSEQSVRILLERGLVQVEGGKALSSSVCYECSL